MIQAGRVNIHTNCDTNVPGVRAWACTPAFVRHRCPQAYQSVVETHLDPLCVARALQIAGVAACQCRVGSKRGGGRSGTRSVGGVEAMEELFHARALTQDLAVIVPPASSGLTPHPHPLCLSLSLCFCFSLSLCLRVSVSCSGRVCVTGTRET